MRLVGLWTGNAAARVARHHDAVMPPPPPQSSANDASARRGKLPAGVFGLQEAEAAGLTRAQLRTLHGNGRIERVGPGLYRDAEHEALDAREWIDARARRLGRDAIIAHTSAAIVWGMRTPYTTDSRARELVILRTREAFGARLGGDVRTLPAQYASSHVVDRNGLRVTTVARTALDLARNCPFERALVTLDHALALGAGRDELVLLARYMSGWPGTRVLRPAIRWAEPTAESGLESMARGRTLARHLPEPRLQLPLVGASGASYRADLAWPERRVVLELDGREKYAVGMDALIAEKRREDDLRQAGWRVVRMQYDDVGAPDGPRWHELAHALGVTLQPYDPEYGMTPRWEPPRRVRRSHRQEHFGLGLKTGGQFGTNFSPF